MNNKGISVLICIFSLAVLIFIQANQSVNLAKSICNKVFENEYDFIVIKKIEEKMNNGQLKLHCKQKKSDSFFVFYPDDIMPYNFIYPKVNVGDTLKKERKSNIFWILNAEKRDSFIFSCKE
jgi:hypothetical protein